ncbi:uncharacterized protein N7446_000314 [Penicillium canescens]|uniref:Uncharacterized protein n=1 Tax=Penicillium canescens TaxID=5083 RepID=A0AAD6I4F8_PENCN|nr:uncharacterized protein N7446_000314 [Penicillium canescens]KAJ6030623.1 hypothetical protein N7460_010889 [Penicillium canescens]KAJ6059662.1 hypothetical protein N7444_003301 [Penicillium canescens]KAJ6077378.1 hypothetical protein N7446_000314 [Penicillium canescens]
MEPIAVDPDFYSIATGFSTDPQDSQSETTSIASSIARGRTRSFPDSNLRSRYQATKEDDYWLVTKHYEALVCVYME